MVNRRKLLVGAAAAILSAPAVLAATPQLEIDGVTRDFDEWKERLTAMNELSDVKRNLIFTDGMKKFNYFMLTPSAKLNGQVILAETKSLRCQYTHEMAMDLSLFSSDPGAVLMEIIMVEMGMEFEQILSSSNSDHALYMVYSQKTVNPISFEPTIKFNARYAIV